MILLDDLLEKERLIIPYPDKVLSVQMMQEGHCFDRVGGVYTFYNRYMEALYVGISHNVSKRVKEHLGTPKGNQDLIAYIKSDKPVYCSVFYEDRKVHQEIYESYLIHVLKPRFNVEKTGRAKL